MLSLRIQAGLTQNELAQFLDVSQGNVTFWEWSDKPPRGDVLPKMAKAFGVRVDDLLLETRQPGTASKQPIGEIQRAFDQVRQLPRSQQRKVVQVVSALLDQYRQKAG